jgi:low affinity Fe/Cu permease
MKRIFSDWATAIAYETGRPVTFLAASMIIAVWVVTGPIFHYSDTWQLVINTGTTIVTFLMVFIIQNTQNRDGAAVQAKLDELIRVVPQEICSLELRRILKRKSQKSGQRAQMPRQLTLNQHRGRQRRGAVRQIESRFLSLTSPQFNLTSYCGEPLAPGRQLIEFVATASP